MKHTAIALASLLSLPALAGPLLPPAGPVAPTMKTLVEVEPRTVLNAQNTPGDADSVYRITQPGSYYLTGNMTVPAGRHGIEIATDGVTIDLMGFVIEGQPASKDGITTGSTTTKRQLRIVNGTIRGMGGHGVLLSAHMAQTAMGHTVQNVTASGNGGTGIYISDGVVSESQASDNGSHGIRAGSSLPATISRCTATNNSDHGISISNGVISHCAATSNTGNGMDVGSHGVVCNSTAVRNGWGFAGAGLTVKDCVAADNWQGGITANSRLVAVNNSVLSETREAGTVGVRVLLLDASRVEGNNIINQSTGIAVNSPGNLVVGNTLRGNTTAANIVAGNRVGTLVSTPSMGAVVGNSGGGSLGTTDPNANLLY